MILSDIIILLFCIIGLTGYKKTHCAFHPGVIVSFSWGIILFCYQHLNHELYPLSNKFLCAISLWVFPFCVFSFLFTNVKSYFPKALYTQCMKAKLIVILAIIFIFINIWGAYENYSLSGGLAYRAILELTANDNMPPVIKFLQRLQLISTIIYALLMIYNDKIQCPKKVVIIHAVTLFLWVFINANKGSIVQLVMVSFFALYYHKKLTFSKFLIAAVFLLSTLYVMQSMRALSDSKGRSSEIDIEKTALIYILSPLKAFDMVLNQEVNYPPGQTFRFFDTVLTKVGLKNGAVQNGEMWVQVPVPTNVYTVMFGYYVDYGYWGILIFGMFLGSCWGILYNEYRKGLPFFTTIYAVLLYALPLQFFADYIFVFLSVFFQIIIVCSVLILHFRWRYSKCALSLSDEK